MATRIVFSVLETMALICVYVCVCVKLGSVEPKSVSHMPIASIHFLLASVPGVSNVDKVFPL